MYQSVFAIILLCNIYPTDCVYDNMHLFLCLWVSRSTMVQLTLVALIGAPLWPVDHRNLASGCAWVQICSRYTISRIQGEGQWLSGACSPTTSHTLLLASCLLRFHWPNRVIWPSPCQWGRGRGRGANIC